MAEIVTPDAAEEMMAKEQPPKTGGLSPEDGLEILGPEPEEIETSQGTFLLGPMSMGQMAKLIPHMKKLLPVLKEQIDKGELDFQTLAFTDYAGFMKAVSIATVISVEKLDKMFPEEMVKLCTKVVVSNLDFFVRTLPRAVGGAKESLVHAIVRWVGAAQSNSSLPPAIPSQPSAATPSDSSDSSLKPS